MIFLKFEQLVFPDIRECSATAAIIFSNKPNVGVPNEQ